MDDQDNNERQRTDRIERSDEEHELLEAKALNDLKNAQTLITISVIAAPVSLIIGGVLLAAVALVCGLVAFAKIRGAINGGAAPADLAANLKRQAWISVFVSSAAFVICGVFFVQSLIMFSDYIANGDLQGLMDAMYGPDAPATDGAPDGDGSASNGQGDPSDASGSGSIWDE